MSLSKLFDNILFQGGLFLLCFVWLRYYIRNNWICLLIAIIIVLILNIVSKLIFKNRNATKALKKNDLIKIIALKKFLVLNNFSLQELYEKKGYVVVEKDDYIIIEKDTIKMAVFNSMSISPLTKEKALENYKNIAQLNLNKFIIFANGAKPDINEVLEYIDTELIIKDSSYIYQQLKEFELLPPLETVKTKKKLSSKFLIIVFNKGRSKYYLLSGIFLLLSSLIIFTPIYYIIFASLLIILSIYSKYNKKFNILTLDI